MALGVVVMSSLGADTISVPGVRAMALAVGAPAVLLSVLGLVGLIRWRTRSLGLGQDASHLVRVSRTLRHGGVVPDADRAVGELVVEQLALLTLILLSPLIVGVGQIVREVVRPDDSAVVVLPLFGVSVVVAVAGLALCVRGLLVARRQGIRPRRLW